MTRNPLGNVSSEYSIGAGASTAKVIGAMNEEMIETSKQTTRNDPELRKRTSNWCSE